MTDADKMQEMRTCMKVLQIADEVDALLRGRDMGEYCTGLLLLRRRVAVLMHPYKADDAFQGPWSADGHSVALTVQ